MQDLIQKDSYTLLNTAQLLGSINVITLKCPCKQILMGQMGQPIVCTACKKVWYVEATAKIKVSEVLADLSANPSAPVDSKLISQ